MPLALLSVTFAANADSPSSAIQLFDVNLVQRDAVGARNDCWDDAPMDARVKCAPLEPEHSYLSVVVTVGATSSTDIVVAYESMDLTATGGTDYVALDGSLTIAPGELTGSFRVDFIDDLVEEGNEEFVVKITPPEDVDIAHDYIHVTIIDEESIKVSVADASESEGHSRGMPVRVILSDWVSWRVSIRLGTTSGTAGPSDYREFDDQVAVWLPYPGFGSFKDFEFRHILIDDSLHEPDESYTLTISGDDYLSKDADSGTMTILDNDDPPSVSIADASGLEDAVGNLTFDVTLNTASGKEITLNYATADDTATAGSDYTQTNGTLTFSAGETTKTIDVAVLEDGSPEEDETFTVTLSNAVSATIGDGTATGTIQDDDPVPTALSIEDVEGSESSDALEFPVTLTGDREAMTTVTVDYATSDGTGTAGSDYTEMSGTLTFATDVTRQTIRVPLLDDETDEPDETFVVTLSNSSGAMLDDSEATGTIRDNDATPTLSTLTTTPTRVLEDGGATAVAVTATLDGARPEATDVAVAVTGSGNADAVDFQNVPSFTITIAAGDKSGTNTFTLTPIDDEVDESDETLTVTGTSIVTVNGTSIATVIVTQVELVDDDATSSSIALTAEPPRVSEGDGATEVGVTATLDASARTEVIEVTVSVAGTGNADAVGFQDVPSFTITIAAGDRSGTATFTLTPIDDNVDESDETLSVTGTSVLPVTGTQVELADDEATSSSISLTAEPPRVSEGDGATAVGVTATLDAGARTEETTVTVTVSGSGDADAVDFAEVADFTITISAGDRSGTGNFTLTPEDDNVDESEETLNVGGSSDLPVTADTVALADDDQPSAAILLSASPGRIAEDGGVAPIQVTATLDASARTVATTVSVSVAGSGNPDAVDYAATPTSFDIMIAAGATTGTETFTVTPEDDEVDEVDEVLDIAGTSDLPVTATSVTLADDEQTSTEILLSAMPSTVSEGAGATPVEVTATLDAGARTVSTTVTVTVTGSGDPDAVDFASVRDFTIMIAAGATSGRWTFTLTPEDDNVAESSETLTVDGSSDLPVTKTSVTLTDDDVASSGIVLSASPSLVSEDGGAVPARVTASLNGAVRQAATTVTVSVVGSGNPRAVDFQPVADFTITIPTNAADGTGTFTLTPLDDGAAEADETLTVSGVSDLPVTPTTVTLADDDDPSTRILLSAVPGRVSEGDGPTPVTVTATLDRALRQQATTVTVTVSGSGDAGAADFAAVPNFAITIPANAASGAGTFTLTPQDDETVEANEQLTVSGVSDLPVTSAAVTLADDDEESTRILLSAVPGRVSEGDGATPVTVTATLDRGLRQQATQVTVTVSGSGDLDAADFVAVADFSITIPANAASGEGTFTLTPEDDATVEADEQLTISGTSALPVTPGGGDARGRRRGVDAHPAVPDGRSAAGVGRRRRDSRDRDGGGGQGRASGRDADRRVGVGQRRSGRGGLRPDSGLGDRDSGECPERHGDFHRGAGRRPDRRGGRGADSVRRLRSAGEAGDHGTAGRRRGVHAHPAVGRSGAGVGGRRPGGGDGDRVPGPGSAPGGDERDRVGIGQRQSACGGLRRGGGLRDHHRGERPERHRDIHANAGGRRRGRGGRDAGVDGRIGPAGHAGVGGPGGRRRDGQPRAVDRRCRGGGERGRSAVRGDAGRPERGGSHGELCDGGPGGVRGSGRRGGHGLRERVGDADVRARRGVADDPGIRSRRRAGRAGRNVRACAGRPARRDARPWFRRWARSGTTTSRRRCPSRATRGPRTSANWPSRSP